MNFVHGNARKSGHSSEYDTWRTMWQRCTNPNRKGYSFYGGAGVSVADRWREFDAFLADVGSKPTAAHTLDRWPNQGGNYEPGNVRWATRGEQARNKKDNRWIEFGGRRMILADWAKEVGIGRDSMWRRLSKGWPLERALTLRKIR